MIFDKNLHEECGVFGVYANHNASDLVYYGLHSLQHRGQEACGIVSNDGENFYIQKGLGLVTEVFNEQNVAKLKGLNAIGHVRYSTAGGGGLENVQPMYFRHHTGNFALAHNGNIVNSNELKRYLEDFSLVIVDVNSDEYSVIDIARSLRVNRSYEEYFKSILGLSDEEMEEEYDIDLEELDDFIKDSTLEEYKVQLEGRIKKTIIERSVALYREGELNDYSKLQALKATRPVDERETFLDYVKG